MLHFVCWLTGHRWENARTLAGPILRCIRCGAIR